MEQRAGTRVRVTKRRALLVLFALVAAPLAIVQFAPPSAAAPCDPPVANPVACENTLPGTPRAQWDVVGPGSPDIQGYATDISYNRGQTATFKVDTLATDYRLEIYRLGYYNGAGARLVATVQPSAALPQNQPECMTDPTTGLVDCGNWAVSATWPIPANAVSGVYLGKLVREDGPAGASHIVFIVRDDTGGSDLLFQTSDTTWQAYNSYGGNSLYTGMPAGRAYKVSYNRPFVTRQAYPSGSTESWLFNAEYPMIRWLESNGYDVSYAAGVDTDRRGAELLEHDAFLSVGHDEYWSNAQRANVENARNSGVDLAFFSGNEMFWKTRWEPSIDGSSTAYRTLVSYKETHANAKIDPSSTWTGTWRDPRFSPPSDGGRPENALTGTIFMVNGVRNDPMTVSEAEGKLRLWRNTSIASLAPGGVATLPAGTLGYEWDEAPDGGQSPPGLVPMSTSTIDVSPQYLQDLGNTYGSGVATHNLTLYRHSSGASVFSAGTVQWSWGLDADHDRAGTPVSAPMQQATVNLLADMGAQPSTIRPGLTAATQSTDNTAPTAVVSAPAAGATVPQGSPVVISGTATDTGGGRIGVVEVSVDNGATWRRATGRETWSYTWTPTAQGPVSVRARAADDSGNLGVASAARQFTVGAPAPNACPCTIWPATAVPASPSNPDTQAVELGVKFRADVNGTVSGVRFYKGTSNTGTHVGKLWSSTGTLLAQATFVNETATGWQQVNFSSPVPVTAGTTYIASYFAPSGGYARDGGFFASSGVVRAPLRALAEGVDGGNGVFRYGPTGGFPNGSYQSSNYWVDVVFNDTPVADPPPSVVAQSPAVDATDVPVATAVTATFSEAISVPSLSFTLRDDASATVAGAVTYDSATQTARLQPSAALRPGIRYTATVSASDTAGNAMPVASAWSFTTIQGCPCTIWPATATPAVASTTDNQAVEVGLKFRASASGYVQGVRFYKGAANTGTHVGKLWSSTGTLLAQATFVNESASGWQQVMFSTPVAISANTTYVISYYAPNGSYARDANAFATTGVNRPPLTALASGVDGMNGVFRYGAGGGFPTNAFESSNYWVDVLFHTELVDQVGPTVVANSPANGATGVARDIAVTATFDEAVQPSTVVFELRTQAGALVPATVTYDSATRTSRLAPTSLLNASTGYTATLSAARDLSGAPLTAPATWSFTTIATDSTPPTITQRSPAANAVDVLETTAVTATFSEDLQTSTVSLVLRDPSGTQVPASVNYAAASRTVTLQPTNALSSQVAYTATATATDLAGNAMTPASWSFTIRRYCPCSIWPASAVPAVAATTDTTPVELGLRFRSDVTGYVTGVRFYKGSGNTGTHVGKLWTNSGTLLAQATFVNETATGWQQVLFSTPVQVTANTTYVVSYYAPAGRYAQNANYFGSSGVANAPLRALANGVDGSNGVYRYGAGGGFPTSTYQASNYWVDVVFAADVPTSVGPCPCSVWDNSVVPGTPASTDTSAVELGMRFQPDTNGQITGVRFYKGTGNTGTHVGKLWTNSGTLLAQATFVNETATGWQQVLFSTPVNVTAGTTYVVSYLAPAGRYAQELDYFATSGVLRSPLRALASGVDGLNGVYRYGATGGFPTSSYRNSNYWVDVLFVKPPGTP